MKSIAPATAHCYLLMNRIGAVVMRISGAEPVLTGVQRSLLKRSPLFMLSVDALTVKCSVMLHSTCA